MVLSSRILATNTGHDPFRILRNQESNEFSFDFDGVLRAHFVAAETADAVAVSNEDAAGVQVVLGEDLGRAYFNTGPAGYTAVFKKDGAGFKFFKEGKAVEEEPDGHVADTVVLDLPEAGLDED